MNKPLLVAQLGRAVGLLGDLKLHIYTDFTQQFKKGASFDTKRGKLIVSSVDIEKHRVRFVGFESRESAKMLTNTMLYADMEQTKKSCELKDGQYFWFDLLDLAIEESGKILGTIKDIERIGEIDYFYIKTEKDLQKDQLSSSFMLPYIPRYIKKVDLKKGRVFTQGAYEILEAS